MFNGKVKLIAISLDEDKADLDNFLKIYGLGKAELITHLWDPTKSSVASFGTNKLPETFIFNKNRQLIRKVPGEEDWASERVINYLNKKITEQTK